MSILDFSRVHGENPTDEQGNIDDIEKERILDTVTDEITHYIKGRDEVVQAIKEARGNTDNSTLLVVNTTFNKGPELITQALEQLMRNGFRDLALLYLQKLFNREKPQTIRDIFQLFFGKLYNVEELDVRDIQGYSNINNQITSDITGVIFSGSGADVTKALAGNRNPVYPGESLSHVDVYELTKALYKRAAELNLPVFGVCYGSQIVAEEKGHSIERLVSEGQIKVGDVLVKPTDLMLEFPFGKIESGMVPVLHGEHVKQQLGNMHSSLLLHADYKDLATSGEDVEVVQGMMHIQQPWFTGNIQHDIAVVEQVLRDKQHIAFGAQVHGEYSSAIKLDLHALGLGGVKEVFGEKRSDAFANKIMEFVSLLFEMHKYGPARYKDFGK